MITWLVAIILVALIFTLIKVKYVKHKAVWIVLIVLFGALYLGYAISISKADIDWNSTNGIETAGKLYLAFFVQAFDNMKTLTGQAINLDWRGNESIVQSNKKINATQEALNKKFHK